MQIERLSDLVIQMGFRLLASGAEIHRVEDTICRIARAYGAQAEVFAIPSSLMVTVIGPDGHTFTQTRRLYHSSADLAQVDALNALARRICRDRPEAGAIEEALDGLERMPRYGARQILAAAALVAGGFALLFGGGLWETLIAALLGALVKAATAALERGEGGTTLANIAGGGICVAGSWICKLLAPGLDGDVMVSSALMLLVPGLLMTNSIRDMIAGDLVTGVMKSAEALLVATAVAIGVFCSLALVRWMTPGVL